MNPKADSSDYTYDISVEDLRRYKTLPPQVILEWLQDAQEFVEKVVRPNRGTGILTFDRLEIKLRPQVHRLRQEFCVNTLAVFGSVSRGDSHQNSDVDFLVQFSGQATFDLYMSLKCFLEDLIGCPIDLVTQDGIRSETRSFIEGDLRRVA